MSAMLALVGLGTFYVLLWSPHALALNPALDLSQYAHTAWAYRDGFVQGKVNAIAQTPDGYLWLATQSGVIRFDGVRTVPLPLVPGQQLPSNSVGALLAARDGTLWIGTLDGLVSWKNGHLTEYPSLARRSVLALLQDHAGTVWVGGLAGPAGNLCTIRDGSTTCYGEDGSLGAAVASLYEDINGSIWVGATTGLWRWTPGPPTHYLAASIDQGSRITQGEDRRGLVVAVSRVLQINGKTVSDYTLHGVSSTISAGTVLRDHDGGLWIGTTAHGLVHSYDGKISIFTHKDGLSSDQVYGLFEDLDGSIWVATSEGLDQFRELPVTSLTLPVVSGPSSPTANSVLAARDGSIWIGTTVGLYRWDHGRARVYRKRSNLGLADDEIQSLSEDEHHRIWVSSFSGLASFKKEKFTAVRSVPSGTKNAITSDNHGGIWLSLFGTANNYSLTHVVDGKITEQVPWGNLGGGPGTGLLPDPNGGIWTGLLSGGIAYFRAGQIQNLPLHDDGARARRVFDISRDRSGTLWAATENGVSRITNTGVATLTTANGLPCKIVHWIIEDDLSSYWLYTQCGLLRISGTEMEAWIADPKRSVLVTAFGATDGTQVVPILKGLRPAVSKAPDGKIWFVNGEKVSFIDPSRIHANMLTPPVHVEQITVDGKTYDVRQDLRLPPHVGNLAIDYTAISLAAPEKVRFHIMLEGQDRTWRELANQRHVEYTNLPPRKYRFRVIASNGSGVWNEQGDTIEFSISPAYYQTNWFRALCFLFFVALLWAAYQVRVRRLQHEFEMTLDARVAERTRIARELHDTLLQGAHGLLLRFETISQLLPDRAKEAKQLVDSAINQTADFITDARGEVQGLRESTLHGNDLALAIRTLGEELASQLPKNRPTFQVSVEGKSRELHPILRDEIYKVAAEALRNSFNHAQARRVEVELRYDSNQFRFRARDDGKGIDSVILSQHAKEGHFGLHGMQERAKVIGAKLTIWSEVESGTEIELSLPAKVAFVSERNRSWLSRMFAAKA